MLDIKDVLTNVTVVLYHDECTDGFGAAYAAWTVLKNKAIYIPVRHGNSPPSGLTGENVLILDFCYPREILLEIKKIANTVVVIDHHSTAINECSDIDGCYFCIEKSGAALAWEAFHKNENMPQLIQYIEDSDLERFSLVGTRSFIAGLRQRDKNFEQWDNISKSQDIMTKLLQEGDLLVKALDNSARIIAKTASPIKIENINGLCASTSWEFASTVALELARKSGTFGLAWYHEGTTVRCSWRSHGNTNVEKLASIYGGGGHINAAGTQHSEDDFLNILKKLRI